MNVIGELFDNGVIRVFVPMGWKLFHGTDSNGNISLKKVHIYKDAESIRDILTKAGITICCFGRKEIVLSTRHFYDNVQDLIPFEMGGYMWNGFTCTSLNYPYTMLNTSYDGITFQVMILTENGENRISLADTDVQAILENLRSCQ